MPDPTSGAGAERPREDDAGELRPGTVLDGRWRIEALIGTGGMSAVYRAEHVHARSKAAVKVLHAGLSRSATERARFRREARVAIRVRSPHLVEVYDVGEDAAGRPYLAMELLEGESLRSVLDREGRLAPARAVRLLRQLLDGLAAAHAEGVIHRDLKPENLWLSGAGAEERLRVLDFGVAKWSDARPDGVRTQAGLVVGTPEYLSPEAAVGGEVDLRADLYAVGVVAYVTLTGRHPFDTSDVRALVAAHAFEKVPRLTAAAPELAAWPRLVEFVARATEKDRTARPGCAADLAALLAGAEVAEPGAAAAANAAPERPARPSRVSLLGIPTAALPAAVNLTLVRVEVAEWAARAVALGPTARARALAEHDAVVLPVVRAFGGRRLAADQGATLLAFRSPTDAVRCAVTVQEAAARAGARPPWVTALRIGVHQGEIRLERGAVRGAPVAAVAAVAASAVAGEVWLTRTVWLTMARSEAPSEEVGTRSIEEEPDPLVLYRIVRPGTGERPRARVRRSRLVERITAPIASIQVAGETEGRARATARVVAAAAALWAMRVVRIPVVAGWLLVRAVALGRREPPGLLGRAVAAAERARERAAERASVLALALRRPPPPMA